MFGCNNDKYVMYNTMNCGNRIVKSRIYNTKSSSYRILNYDKDILCKDDTDNAIYRSVIYSNPEHELLCFSPPKSIAFGEFINKYPNFEDGICANEIIEGVMINMFFDKRVDSWEIATKCAVSGNYSFIKKTQTIPSMKESFLKSPQVSNGLLLSKKYTFLEMFMDALHSGSRKIKSNPIVEYFPKQYTYSFVLQHPKNTIVLNIEKPRIFLVAVYEICENRVVQIPSTIFEEWDFLLNLSGIIEFPKKMNEDNYQELIHNYCTVYTDFIKPGIMLTNLNTGERSKLLNPVYRKIQKNRIHIPNVYYHFLCLRRISKTDLFLEHYPSYKKCFKKFEYEYKDFVNQLHESYLLRYVKKSPIVISEKYTIHISKIHKNVFLKSLGGNIKKMIQSKDIEDYLGKFTPDELLFYLNYDRRNYPMSMV